MTSWAGGVAGASSAAWRTGTSTSVFVAAASARSSAARAAWAARRERGDASGAAAGAGDDELPESLESVLADESVSVSEYPAAALRSREPREVDGDLPGPSPLFYHTISFVYIEPS